jgi:transposase
MSWSSSSLIYCAHAPANSSTPGKSRVRASQIRELQGFVVSIERDKAAVVAGLTLPQNNGLVEGNVNQLKLIKRMMYGRAAFPLLRQRVLHAL